MVTNSNILFIRYILHSFFADIFCLFVVLLFLCLVVCCLVYCCGVVWCGVVRSSAIYVHFLFFPTFVYYYNYLIVNYLCCFNQDIFLVIITVLFYLFIFYFQFIYFYCLFTFNLLNIAFQTITHQDFNSFFVV